MATTLANYLTYLSEDYIRDPNHRIWGQTTKERAVNKAYLQIMKDLGLGNRMQSSSATSSQSTGDNSYTLPADFWAVETVDRNGGELQYTSRKTVVDVEGSTSNTGTPSHYYLGTPAGNGTGTMYLYPTPATAGTLTLYYFASLPVLTSGVDSSLPLYVDDAVMLYASHKLFVGVDTEKSMLYKELYGEKINDIRYLMGMDIPYKVRNQREYGGEYPDRI